MVDSLKMDVVLPVSPEALYDAWLDSDLHEAFTEGGPATIEAHVGGAHSAWDRYITGEQRVLERPSKIVQTWRTTEFSADAPDSLVTVLFEAVPGGTRLTVIHENLPPGTTEAYLKGWEDFYFQPMLKFFAPAKKAAPKTKSAPKKKAVVKKKAAAKKKSMKTAAPKKKALPKGKAKKVGAVKKTAKSKAKKPARSKK